MCCLDLRDLAKIIYFNISENCRFNDKDENTVKRPITVIVSKINWTDRKMIKGAHVNETNYSVGKILKEEIIQNVESALTMPLATVIKRYT